MTFTIHDSRETHVLPCPIIKLANCKQYACPPFKVQGVGIEIKPSKIGPLNKIWVGNLGNLASSGIIANFLNTIK